MVWFHRILRNWPRQFRFGDLDEGALLSHPNIIYGFFAINVTFLFEKKRLLDLDTTLPDDLNVTWQHLVTLKFLPYGKMWDMFDYFFLCDDLKDRVSLSKAELICVLSLSHLVSWVKCGTWLYRFLTFATFLILIRICYQIETINQTWGSGWGIMISE